LGYVVKTPFQGGVEWVINEISRRYEAHNR
jgi:hypothetical protein